MENYQIIKQKVELFYDRKLNTSAISCKPHFNVGGFQLAALPEITVGDGEDYDYKIIIRVHLPLGEQAGDGSVTCNGPFDNFEYKEGKSYVFKVVILFDDEEIPNTQDDVSGDPNKDKGKISVPHGKIIFKPLKKPSN